MTRRRALDTRLELARGHWELGEAEEALRCLELAIEEDPDDPEVRMALTEIERSAGADRLAIPLRARLASARARIHTRAEDEAHEALPPVATSTLAELLEAQGHRDQALRVAEEVLRRNPEDARAGDVRARLRDGEGPPPGGGRDSPLRGGVRPQQRRIATLERWLRNARRRQARGGAEA